MAKKIGIIELNNTEGFGTRFIVDFSEVKTIIVGDLKTKMQVVDGSIEMPGSLKWAMLPEEILLSDGWEGAKVVAEATNWTMDQAEKSMQKVRELMAKNQPEAPRVIGVGSGAPQLPFPPKGRG